MNDGTIKVELRGDDEIVHAGIVHLLGRESDMEVVFDGEIDATECRPFDVAVLTIGSEQTHLLDDPIKPYDRGDEPPLLVLSSVDDADFAAAIIGAGASGYLLRDAGPEALVNGIRAVHSGSIVISSRIVTAYQSRSSPPNEPGRDPLNSDDALSCLTDREHDVATLLSTGLSNSEIGRHLSVSESTVKTHLSNCYAKLGVDSRVSLALLAHGIKHSL